MAVHPGPYRGPRNWADRGPIHRHHNPAYPSSASSSVMNDAFNTQSHFRDGEELVTVTLPRYLLNNLPQEQIIMSNQSNAKTNAANDTTNATASAEADLRRETTAALDEQIDATDAERRTIEERLSDLRQRREQLNQNGNTKTSSPRARRFAKIALGVLATGAAVYAGVLGYKRFVAA